MITTTLFDRFLGFFSIMVIFFIFQHPFEDQSLYLFNFRRELFLNFLIVPFKDQNQNLKEYIYTPTPQTHQTPLLPLYSLSNSIKYTPP